MGRKAFLELDRWGGGCFAAGAPGERGGFQLQDSGGGDRETVSNTILQHLQLQRNLVHR